MSIGILAISAFFSLVSEDPRATSDKSPNHSSRRKGMGSRPADINFYACSSRRRIRLQADVIIDRIVKTLLAPEVSLRRLNRNVAEQELDLI
jgi:hypothetical protein